MRSISIISSITEFMKNFQRNMSEGRISDWGFQVSDCLVSELYCVPSAADLTLRLCSQQLKRLKELLCIAAAGVMIGPLVVFRGSVLKYR